MNQLTLGLILSLLLSGCSSVLTAARDEPIRDDRGTRTFGSKIDDPLIETKVEVNIAKADPALEVDAHVVVVSYNGVVLLAGQVPSAELKEKAEQAARMVQRVKTVHNELQVGPNSALLARNNDTWITTKIKSKMLAEKDLPSTRIKVISENGIVYMMGMVTRQEASKATLVVQSVDGVQKIVKLFEYLN